MTTKKVTICGKEVKLAYCYATEIAFNDMTGEELPAFIQQAGIEIKQKQTPNVKRIVFAIVAAMLPCYSDSDEAPIKDSDIMKEATPEELGVALGTILLLYGEFYHIPNGEPEDKPEDDDKAKKNRKRKNA